MQAAGINLVGSRSLVRVIRKNVGSRPAVFGTRYLVPGICVGVESVEERSFMCIHALAIFGPLVLRFTMYLVNTPPCVALARCLLHVRTAAAAVLLYQRCR